MSHRITKIQRTSYSESINFLKCNEAKCFIKRDEIKKCNAKLKNASAKLWFTPFEKEKTLKNIDKCETNISKLKQHKLEMITQMTRRSLIPYIIPKYFLRT